MTRKKNQQVEQRGYVIVFAIVATLAVIGLAESTYLAVLHLTGVTAVCGDAAGCYKVLNSPYAAVAGIPVALFGAVAYYGAFAFAVFAAFGYEKARKFLALTVWVMFAATLWLLYVQAFLVRGFCQYCLISAAIIFLLAGLVVAGPRPGQRD